MRHQDVKLMEIIVIPEDAPVHIPKRQGYNSKLKQVGKQFFSAGSQKVEYLWCNVTGMISDYFISDVGFSISDLLNADLLNVEFGMPIAE